MYFRGVLDNDTTTRYRMYLNGSGVKKLQSIRVYVILQTGMELAEYFTILNYAIPRPQNESKSKDRRTVAGKGVKPAPTFVLPSNNKGRVVKEPPLVC